MSNRASALEVQHRLQSTMLLQGLPGRRAMELDHVQIVGVHAGQALFDARQDIVTREDMRVALAARSRRSPHQAAAFAREIIFRAPIGNVAANAFFADAIINRRIDIIDAGIEHGRQNGFCLRVCDVAATRRTTEFHGPTPGVDLSCETGTCGYDPNVYSTVAIADPSLAPYGVAAQTVLTGRYGLTPPLSSNPLVHEYPNITATFNAVIAQTDPVGFVAMSAICADGHYPTPGNGTSAVAYFSIGSGATPGVLINNYNPLTQAGIAIRNNRTPFQNIGLEDFVAFLMDSTTSPEPDSPMIATLKKYCYNAP